MAWTRQVARMNKQTASLPARVNAVNVQSVGVRLALQHPTAGMQPPSNRMSIGRPALKSFSTALDKQVKTDHLALPAQLPAASEG